MIEYDDSMQHRSSNVMHDGTEEEEEDDDDDFDDDYDEEEDDVEPDELEDTDYVVPKKGPRAGVLGPPRAFVYVCGSTISFLFHGAVLAGSRWSSFGGEVSLTPPAVRVGLSSQPLPPGCSSPA
ncbi:UNVERIFIED_CONTAM: hypothetical protein FKN15_052794 [Acipenser sinensis]